MADTSETNEIAPIDIWGIKPETSTEETKPTEEETAPVEVTPKEEPKAEAPKNAPAKADPETEEETDDFASFFSSVEAITGDAISGGYDNTAEGIAGYITAAKEKAVNDTFNRIQADDPRAYAYLVHRVNGGSDSDFFAAAGNANLPTIAQVRSNPAVQEAVVRNFYMERGLGQYEADLLVKAALDDDKLAASAEGILNQQIVNEANRSTAYLAQEASNQEATDAAIYQSAQYITSVVSKGDLNGWTIPKQEHNAFLDYIDQRFDYVGGKAYLKIELSDENLNKELQSQYLAYKNGNLTDLVNRQVKTSNVARLKLKVADASKTSKGPNSESTGTPTLSSVW